MEAYCRSVYAPNNVRNDYMKYIRSIEKPIGKGAKKTWKKERKYFDAFTDFIYNMRLLFNCRKPS